MSVSIKVLVTTATVLICLREIQAIKCYVCQDCENSDKYNETHLIECKRNQERCIKMELLNGAIDRACGDKKKGCMGREGARKTRAIIDARTEEIIIDTTSKRRTVRQLLQAPSSGGSNTKANDKNKDKNKKPEPGALEIKTLHCCADEKCNGVPVIQRTAISSAIFAIVLHYFFIFYN